MASVRRLAAGGLATLMTLALTTLPAHAATKRTAAPTAVAPAKRPSVLPPLIFQIDPIKVDPTVQPNIMILGQHLTPASTVQVGGRPATTVQASDTYHMLVKLPDNLAQGSYSIEVTNEAGTATAPTDLTPQVVAPEYRTRLNVIETTGKPQRPPICADVSHVGAAAPGNRPCGDDLTAGEVDHRYAAFALR